VDPLLPFALFGLVVIVVGIAAYLAYEAEQKRRRLLQGFALSSGWDYRARDDSWTERFDGGPFGQGDHRRADNVLAGRYGERDMVAFDYSFQTHSNDSKGNRQTTTHRYTVCALRLPAYLRELELSPESLLTRVATAVGFADVELESEDFNRRYRVRARDPKFAYDVLHPRTMDALLARRPLHLRISGADALCWESGRLKPPQLLEHLSTLALLVDGIPSFVWSDHSPGGAPA
jgi:hypothetical protein